MQKVSLLLVVLMFYVGLWAQNSPAPHNFSIDWQEPALQYTDEEGVEYKQLYFTHAGYDHKNIGIPYYDYEVELGNADYEVKATLSIRKSANLTASERQLFDNTLRPEKTEVFVASNRGKKSAVVRIPVVYFEGGTWKKILEGTISFQISQRPARKSGQSFANSSVLATGNWYRVSVERTGVYRITPALLNDLGHSGQVPINQIGVFGNGEGMLPELVGARITDDLIENQVLRVDANNDGIFNGNDYILFFAYGPHRWEYRPNIQEFEHVYHPYSDKSFYFINVEQNNALSIQTAAPEATNANTTVTTFNDFDFIQESKVNLIRAGRNWFGDVFDFNLTYSYSFAFPNIDNTVPARVRLSAAARSIQPGTFFETRLGNVPIMQSNIPQLNTAGSYPDFARMINTTATFTASGNSVNLVLNYNNAANPSATGWMRFLTVQLRRQLRMSGNSMIFRDVNSVGVGNVARYEIDQANPNLIVWEVTRVGQFKQMPLNFSGNQAAFLAGADSLRTFVSFSGSNFPLPSAEGKVENQNLHAASVPDYLIISHSNYLSASNRLSDYRSNRNGYDVLVVTPQQIYNEYSSGIQDISAIRDFIRHLYLKDNNNKFKYVALMGTASYDFRDVVANNTNFVPVYQSVDNNINIISSFITDDFYGQLDEGEGLNLISGKLDVGIGRFTVRTVAQSNAVVDKVIHYETNPRTLGPWRNRMLFVADDAEAPWEVMFMQNSDILANMVNQKLPHINTFKIYSDAYQQIATSGSRQFPETRSDIFRQVQRGNLITNYIGHGGEVGWAQEQILRLQEINNWSNINTMPVFVTITCEFTRFDEVWRTSAGEQVLVQPNGAGIALISTTRAVLANTGVALNIALFNQLFETDTQGYVPLATSTLKAKNTQNNIDKLKFSFFGDPALRLPMPLESATLTQINNINIADFSDTLKALSRVSIEGEILKEDNTPFNTFNGEINLSVFDKPVTTQTLDNNNIGDVHTFQVQNSIIYNGRATVANGKYNFEFIIPKDINYSFGKGRFSMYAQENDEQTQAVGYFNEAIIGGLDENAPVDNEGPDIRLYMNDESFVFGGITDQNPRIFALVFDSSGINTAGNSIGRDITAILNQKDNEPIILNEYYTADLNSFQSGVINYPFFNLNEGNYSLSLRVWDTHNNPSIAVTEFVVAENSSLALKHILNYPNPFTTNTAFQFEHNRPNQPLQVQVQVFTVSGKLVKTINSLVNSPGTRVTDIHWDGLDDYGGKIGKGVYIYRLKVKSLLDDALAEEYEKLVILR